MQCRNAAKYPFNFRPLVCAAFGLGAGVAIGMHISGARALLAALLLLIAAYIMHAKKQRAATVMLLSAAAGLLRVAGYAFLPREEVSEIIEKARFSRNHTPTALMPTVESLYARCDALFAEASPLARAILLGDRSTLGYFQRYAFRASGVSHTLALSGLHVSALTLVLLRCIPPNRPRVRVAFVFAFLGIYCAVAGFPASLMRAAIMFMCIVLAPLCLRRNDTASALSLAFIIIVCAEPLSIYSAGFCLSFAAVAGIAMLYAPIMCRLPRVLAPVGTTVAATLGTLPFTVMFFGEFSTYSIIANIFIVPLITLALPIGLIALVLSYISAPLGTLLAVPARLMLGASESISAAIASLPYAQIKLSGFNGLTCALYFAALIVLSKYCLMDRNKKLIYGCVLLALGTLSVILA